MKSVKNSSHSKISHESHTPKYKKIENATSQFLLFGSKENQKNQVCDSATKKLEEKLRKEYQQLNSELTEYFFGFLIRKEQKDGIWNLKQNYMNLNHSF